MKPTQEQVIAWARDVGISADAWVSDKTIQDFFTLAYEAGRKDENEACAKVCEELGYYVKHGGWTCADEIRARGQE